MKVVWSIMTMVSPFVALEEEEAQYIVGKELLKQEEAHLGSPERWMDTALCIYVNTFLKGKTLKRTHCM